MVIAGQRRGVEIYIINTLVTKFPWAINIAIGIVANSIVLVNTATEIELHAGYDQYTWLHTLLFLA